MENIYEKLNRIENDIIIKEQNKFPKMLHRTSSAPLFSTFQAAKLPSCISGTVPYQKKDEKITSSDIKVQILEERLKKLENLKSQQITSNPSLLNPSNNFIQFPLIQLNPIQNPLSIQSYPILDSYFPLINNKNYNDKLNNLNERQIKLYELDKLKHRKSINNNSYNKHIEMKIKKEKEKFYNNLENITQIEKEKEMRNKYKNYYKKLQREIFTPLQDDYSNYKRRINLNIQEKLKNDNKMIKSNINEIEGNYNQIKILLNEKLHKIEKRQKIDFENLKNVLKKVGGKKMNRAIQNVFDGTNYDLQKAGDEDLLNEIGEILPILIKEKFEKDEKMKEEIDKQLREDINRNIYIEFQKQRQIEELKHQEKLKKMKLQQKKERIENMKLLNELKFQIMRDKIKNKNIINDNNNNNNYYYKNKINNYNNYFDNFSIDNIFKLLIMKKIKKLNKKYPLNINKDLNNINMNDILNKLLYNKILGNKTEFNDILNINNNNENSNENNNNINSVDYTHKGISNNLTKPSKYNFNFKDNSSINTELVNTSLEISKSFKSKKQNSTQIKSKKSNKNNKTSKQKNSKEKNSKEKETKKEENKKDIHSDENEKKDKNEVKKGDLKNDKNRRHDSEVKTIIRESKKKKLKKEDEDTNKNDEESKDYEEIEVESDEQEEVQKDKKEKEENKGEEEENKGDEEENDEGEEEEDNEGEEEEENEGGEEEDDDEEGKEEDDDEEGKEEDDEEDGEEIEDDYGEIEYKDLELPYYPGTDFYYCDYDGSWEDGKSSRNTTHMCILIRTEIFVWGMAKVNVQSWARILIHVLKH